MHCTWLAVPRGPPYQARGRQGASEGCWSRPCLLMPQLNPEAGGPGTNLTHEARPLGPGLPHPHATSLQSYPVFRPLASAKAHGYHTAAESQPGARALPGQMVPGRQRAALAPGKTANACTSLPRPTPLPPANHDAAIRARPSCHLLWAGA